MSLKSGLELETVKVKVKCYFKKILNKTKSKIISITYGSNGTKVFSQNRIANLPAFSKNVVDTMGAGDAFFCYIVNIYNRR